MSGYAIGAAQPSALNKVRPERRYHLAWFHFQSDHLQNNTDPQKVPFVPHGLRLRPGINLIVCCKADVVCFAENHT